VIRQSTTKRTTESVLFIRPTPEEGEARVTIVDKHRRVRREKELVMSMIIKRFTPFV